MNMIIEYIMPFIDGVVDIFSQGGIITYVILFVGIYGLIIALRKIAYLKKISKVDTTEIFGVVTASMERGGAVEALKQINGFKNPISRIISETLKIGYKNKTEYEYNALGFVNKIIAPDGTETNYKYNYQGQLEKITDIYLICFYFYWFFNFFFIFFVFFFLFLPLFFLFF